MAEIIELGKVSTRGQIAIPAEIRERMHLKEGSKLLFIYDRDSLLLKKMESVSWRKLTRPLRDAQKKVRKEDVPKIVHRPVRK